MLDIEKRIRYLEATNVLKLTIDKNKPPVLTTYCDTDWASEKCDKKWQQGIYLNLEITYFPCLKKNKREWPCHEIKQKTNMVLSLENLFPLYISFVHLNMTSSFNYQIEIKTDCDY